MRCCRTGKRQQAPPAEGQAATVRNGMTAASSRANSLRCSSSSSSTGRVPNRTPRSCSPALLSAAVASAAAACWGGRAGASCGCTRTGDTRQSRHSVQSRRRILACRPPRGSRRCIRRSRRSTREWRPAHLLHTPPLWGMSRRHTGSSGDWMPTCKPLLPALLPVAAAWRMQRASRQSAVCAQPARQRARATRATTRQTFPRSC